MKKILLISSLFFLLVSCKNQEKKNEIEDIRLTEQESNSNETPETDRAIPGRETSGEKIVDKKDSFEKPNKPANGNSENTSTAQVSNTRYVKVNKNEADCSCFCIDVVTSGQSELCIKQDEIYINARFSQSGNTIMVYFSGPSAKNTNEELPWEDFDTNTPIAEIMPTENGMELDWKGFSVDGELAIDYAIYGKKTLEGSYKKQ
ncbi:MAG TPA: hypothetical protein VIM94_11345 [Salegentibacter sp.]|uniref:hypothetical protein n=1 Tax=Salegentibacter sp. TaxID=1903072 RepID=UPI002F92F9DB